MLTTHFNPKTPRCFQPRTSSGLAFQNSISSPLHHRQPRSRVTPTRGHFKMLAQLANGQVATTLRTSTSRLYNIGYSAYPDNNPISKMPRSCYDLSNQRNPEFLTMPKHSSKGKYHKLEEKGSSSKGSSSKQEGKKLRVPRIHSTGGPESQETLIESQETPVEPRPEDEGYYASNIDDSDYYWDKDGGSGSGTDYTTAQPTEGVDYLSHESSVQEQSASHAQWLSNIAWDADSRPYFSDTAKYLTEEEIVQLEAAMGIAQNPFQDESQQEYGSIDDTLASRSGYNGKGKGKGKGKGRSKR
ncbi:hypothetical protein F5Y18DRAFT_397259 [Xylariaceae sp. FL1019]|nr:hypothetical protein F5Y18DRAFT_397259 [Xylariaceae sp. FL1019]